MQREMFVPRSFLARRTKSRRANVVTQSLALVLVLVFELALAPTSSLIKTPIPIEIYLLYLLYTCLWANLSIHAKILKPVTMTLTSRVCV